jgi:hypothetical protein
MSVSGMRRVETQNDGGTFSGNNTSPETCPEMTKQRYFVSLGRACRRLFTSWRIAHMPFASSGRFSFW